VHRSGLNELVKRGDFFFLESPDKASNDSFNGSFHWGEIYSRLVATGRGGGMFASAAAGVFLGSGG